MTVHWQLDFSISRMRRARSTPAGPTFTFKARNWRATCGATRTSAMHPATIGQLSARTECRWSGYRGTKAVRAEAREVRDTPNRRENRQARRWLKSQKLEILGSQLFSWLRFESRLDHNDPRISTNSFIFNRAGLTFRTIWSAGL